MSTATTDLAKQIELNVLVPRRSDVQRFLLDLHNFGNRAATATEKIAFQNLVGVGYSLWRAVFLTSGVRDANVTHQAAREFLEILIKDNAIGYPQESRYLPWTSGFYLNNAYYRLDCLYAFLNIAKPRYRGEVEEFLRRQRTDRPDTELGPPLVEHWDTAFAAANEILTHAQSLSSH